jgi:hypothetical protein
VFKSSLTDEIVNVIKNIEKGLGNGIWIDKTRLKNSGEFYSGLQRRQWW